MVLNTSASISFSQLNSAVFFTNGNLGVNTTSPTVNLDVNGTINVSNISSLANVTATNITASNLISTTSVSSGILSATNVIGTNITAGTLSASTITASNLSLSGDLNIGGTLSIVNITSTNIKDTNISTGTLNASGLSSLTNVTVTAISSGNFIASTGITSGTIRTGSSTIANLNATNISTGVIKATTGITTGTLTLGSSGQASLGNVTATNITSSSLNATGTSILTNTIATNVSVGTGVASTGITTGTINALGTSSLTNTTVTNISTGGLNASGTSVLVNLATTNISTGGLNASGTSVLSNTTATNISTAVLITSTGITSGSINANSVTATTFTVPNMISTNITSGRLEMSGTTNFILQSTPSATSSSYAEFNKASGTVRALVGLDGQGFTGITTGSFTISIPTAHPIYFLTNQTNRMAIHSAGNIGIGTITPSYPLDVNGSMKATSITLGNLNVSGGSLFVNKSGVTGGILFNPSNPYTRIYDDANLHMWTDDNMYFDIGTQVTSASTQMYVNSTGVGIGGVTASIHPLSINTTTDRLAINSDAYNSLIIYEDMKGTSLRHGAISGNASYIQNTGGTTGYVQLSPDSGGSGDWYFTNTNLGNAFTVDYQVQVPGAADAHAFYWGFDGGQHLYIVEFHEWQDRIKLYWAGNLLTEVGWGMGQDSNWRNVRIVFQRNTIKIYFNGNLVINYKDTARHYNYSNSQCGFYCYTGGSVSAHRIRELKIQKLVEGLWTYTSQTSGNIMFNGGNVGINTSTPAYTLDVGGTIARSGARLPVFNNGTFSGASTATIPILFSDTAYNYVEIKVRFILSSIADITLSGNNGSGTTMSIYEQNERTVKHNSQSSPIYTQSGLIASGCEQLGIDALCTITIAQASGTSYGNRYHYSFDTTYCWNGVGSTRAYGSGFLSATNGGNSARQPLGNIILTCSTGTISGTYSTQHSY